MVLIDKQLFHESLARITPFDEERIMTFINLVCLLQIQLILVLFVKNVHPKFQKIYITPCFIIFFPVGRK